jgi:transcriptional regulator with XRE-family HTH domain
VEVNVTVGANLKRIRKERGLSQPGLAERSGVPQPTISNIENDRREPHASTLRKLGDALSVPVAAFFAEEPERPKLPPLPVTPIARLSPEEVDEQLREQAAMEPIEELMASMDRERDSLTEWLKAYDNAPKEEKLARRVDANQAKQKRALLKLYRLAAFDRLSKILDPRDVSFKTVNQIAVESVDAGALLLALLENEATRQRIEKAGEAS